MKEKVIAIVDDDPDDIDFMVQAFQRTGIRENITVYSTGKGFLETVMGEADLPLLTLLDYNMPYLTGEAVLIEMRQHPNFSTTKVIVLSTGMHTALETRLTELGAYCCITKPSSEEGYIHIAQQLKKILTDLQQGKEADLDVFGES